MPWVGNIWRWTPEEEKRLGELIANAPIFPLGDPRSGFILAKNESALAFADVDFVNEGLESAHVNSLGYDSASTA